MINSRETLRVLHILLPSENRIVGYRLLLRHQVRAQGYLRTANRCPSKDSNYETNRNHSEIIATIITMNSNELTADILDAVRKIFLFDSVQNERFLKPNSAVNRLNIASHPGISDACSFPEESGSVFRTVCRFFFIHLNEEANT